MKIRKFPAFEHLQWNPDGVELRRFAGAMLVGFGVLGLLAIWKQHSVGQTTYVLWGVGIALAVGSQIPGLGRRVYLGVYLPSSLLGYCISRAVLTGVFFLVFTPLGAVLRLAGKDLLRLKRGKGPSEWTPHAGRRGRSDYYRQF